VLKQLETAIAKSQYVSHGQKLKVVSRVSGHYTFLTSYSYDVGGP
jgi:hypothetical protein